jgi:hypothetical protein
MLRHIDMQIVTYTSEAGCASTFRVRQSKKIAEFKKKTELVQDCSSCRTETLRLSEVTVTIYQSTRRNIPEDSSLHQHRSKNLKSSLVSHCIMQPSSACGLRPIICFTSMETYKCQAVISVR